MHMGLGLYQQCAQRLSLEQRHCLKQLLSIGLRLRHPGYPNAAKGLDGMLIAHKILKENESAGILIGGLSESVWNKRRKVEDLNKHKDVDVLILDDFEPEKFQGGIDWWLRCEGNLNVRYQATVVENARVAWYENGNSAILSFGAKKIFELSPGLYIPDYRWVLDMKEYEASANMDIERVEIDSDVWDKFKIKLEERIKTKLPKFIRDEFKSYILSDEYERDCNKTAAVSLERFDLNTITAIKNYCSA